MKDLAISAMLAAFLLSAHNATAEPSQAQISAMRSACPADYRSYCASVPPGGQAALDCLQKNLAKLSSACQSAVNAAHGTPPPAASTDTPAGSKSDAAQPEKHDGAPADVARDSAAASESASPEPMPELTPLQEIRLIRESCGPDFRKLCGNVPLGQGRAASCLASHKASLSQGCVGALAEAGLR